MPSGAQELIARMNEHARQRAEQRNEGIGNDDAPRGAVPVTWVAVSPDGMVIQRKTTHPSNILRQVDTPVTFHRDHYVDCMHCRKDRYDRRERWNSVEEMRRNTGYWCNACQATGWDIEPVEVLRARLGLTTWRERIAALQADVLIKAVAGNNPEGFPRDLLLEEAAARYAAGTDTRRPPRWPKPTTIYDG